MVTENDIILFDTEKNKAHYEKLVEQKGEDEARRRLKNYVQRKGEITDPENAQVVQTRDDQNNVVKEEVVESDRVQEAVDSQQATAKPTDEVVVTDPESAQQDRVDTIAAEQYTPPAQGFGQETSDVQQQQQQQQQEQAPADKTREEWLSELPEGWVIPKKGKQPWYKTKGSATAAKNILKKKGGIYTIQPFAEGFALVPVENNLSPAPTPKTNPLPENITPEQVEDTPAQAEAALFDGQESDWQASEQNQQAETLKNESPAPANQKTGSARAKRPARKRVAGESSSRAKPRSREEVVAELRSKGHKIPDHKPRSKKEWREDLPAGWVIPTKSPDPWYKTQASATAARKIKERQGQLYEVEKYGEGFALVPVAAREETGKLKLAPNGKPWPFRSAAQSQADIYNINQDSPDYRVVELRGNKGYALREVTGRVEGKEQQTVLSQPESDARVDGGQHEKGTSGRATSGTGRVSGTVEGEEAEGSGKLQKALQDLRDRYAEQGIKLPEVTDQTLKLLNTVAEGDSEIAADAQQLLERAEYFKENFGLEHRQAVRYAMAEREFVNKGLDDSELSDEELSREQEIEAYLAEQQQQELDADEQVSDELNELYDEKSATFVDQLTVDEIKDKDKDKPDLDGYDRVLPFINSNSRFLASAYKEVQQLYLKWASAAHPTFEFNLVPKDHPREGSYKHQKAKRDRRGRITRKEQKLPFMGVAGVKRVFGSEAEATTFAEKLGRRYRGNNFIVKEDRDGFIVERYQKSQHEITDTDDISSHFDAFFAKAQKQAHVAFNQPNKKILFHRNIDYFTGEPVNEDVELHAPTITEMGRKLNPYIDNSHNLAEKEWMWFNYGMSVLMERGFVPVDLEVTKGKKWSKSKDESKRMQVRVDDRITGPRDIDYSPSRSGRKISDYQATRTELNEISEKINELEGVQDQLAEDIGEMSLGARRAKSGLTPREQGILSALSKQITELTSLAMTLEKQLIAVEAQIRLDSSKAESLNGSKKILESRIKGTWKQITDLMTQRRGIRGQDHGVDLSPVISEYYNKLKGFRDKRNENRQTLKALYKREKELTGRDVKDFDRDDIKEAPAGDAAFEQVIGKGEAISLSPAGGIRKEVVEIKEWQKGGKDGEYQLVTRKGVKATLARNDTSPETQSMDSLREQDPDGDRTFDALNDQHTATVPPHKGSTPIPKKNEGKDAERELREQNIPYARKQALKTQGIDFDREPYQTAGDGITKTELSLVRSALTSIGGKMKVLVVSKDWYANNKGLLPDHPFVNPDSIRKGKYIPAGDIAVVVLDPLTKTTKKNQGNRLFVLAHEVAHALEDHIYANLTTLQKALLNKGYAAYRAKGGKENKREWMADKVGSYLFDKASRAKNFENPIAKQIATKLRGFYKAAAKFISDRFQQSKSVNQVMDELIEMKVFEKMLNPSQKQGNFGVFDSSDPAFRQDMAPTMAKMKGLALAIKKQFTKAGLAYKIGTYLYTSDRQSRDLGDRATALAQHFFLNPGETVKLVNAYTGEELHDAFFNRVTNTRDRLWRDFFKVSKKINGRTVTLAQYFGKPKRLER